VALELLAKGTWSGSGVLGPEAFDAVPFLELLTAYGSPWGQKDLSLFAEWPVIARIFAFRVS
jgi:saccharopine dehydrogenase (NAD+, L-lysine-forming)